MPPVAPARPKIPEELRREHLTREQAQNGLLVIPTFERAGSLSSATDAPEEGERSELLLDHRNLRIEQILSGRNDVPQAYLQSDDEWVVVLAGGAVIDIDGERLALGPGDWAFLPAGVPHTVLETRAGTSWLAVHLRSA